MKNVWTGQERSSTLEANIREQIAAKRYKKLRRWGEVITEAAARADAQARLDAALRYAR